MKDSSNTHGGRTWAPVLVLTGLLTVGCAAGGSSGSLPAPPSAPGTEAFATTDLTGEWEVSDGDIELTVVLDCRGTGRYEWQEGRIVTTLVRDRYWAGHWYQPGNDREGGFAVVLSEDHSKAEGRWWYSKIGDRHVAPSEGGGTFNLTRPPDQPGHTAAQQEGPPSSHCSDVASG